jgi:transcription initiation factor IIE alpha subunit
MSKTHKISKDEVMEIVLYLVDCPKCDEPIELVEDGSLSPSGCIGTCKHCNTEVEIMEKTKEIRK